ncbi:MAG: hypothetical protein JWQ76_2607 [Ramlibacter sp.]|nr:hypothetical protein [Ramlibacter sp.]
MKRILLMAVLMLLAATALALPSVEAVQAQVQHGNYAQAEGMMREVVAARPDSARAHYVYAEILAHDRHFDQAAQELRTARQIAPDLGFTQPDRFRAFEHELGSEQSAARGNHEVPGGRPKAPAMQSMLGSGRGGVPGLAWVVGAAAIAVLLWRGFSGRSLAAPMPSAPAMTAPAGSAPAGYGAPPPGSAYGPGIGSNAAGSSLLGTGLAAAGGLATGMLVEKLLDGRSASAGVPATAAGSGFAPAAIGGAPDANPAAADLEQRPIDFGSGDEWGGGGVDDNSGGVDDNSSGGGDDSGGGGW